MKRGREKRGKSKTKRKKEEKGKKEEKRERSVVEPELEPQGAETFGGSRSWSRYLQVSALAPGSGSGSS
jgi:hypothetical protein